MKGRNVVAVGGWQSAVDYGSWSRVRRARAERRVGELVTMNLALDALEMPVGWRLSIAHFALSASVSPLALAAARRRP